tara:strand:- start:582 stop:1544 length:963 start_codon:yes stop_codon:yes gene_type:complete
MKILAVQNRMGIGDTVIFLPFIKALYKKYNSPISLLVKESSKADQYLSETKYIDKIIILERDQKNNNRHDGFLGSFNLIKDLRACNFDKIFIFNSSLRFNLIAKFSNIPEVFQYPLFNKNKQHIVNTPKKFMKDKLNIDFFDDPEIHVDSKLVAETSKKFLINKEESNVLLGIGGSGPTKRIPANIFLKFMAELIKKKKCKFFLATGKNIDEQKILNKILNSEMKKFCIPLDNLSIKEILPIIKNCDISICNDTGFSHLSAALGIETITLMADTPLIYGNYSSKMTPIIPDGEIDVSHDTLGKDRINPEKVLKKIIEIIG